MLSEIERGLLTSIHNIQTDNFNNKRFLSTMCGDFWKGCREKEKKQGVAAAVCWLDVLNRYIENLHEEECDVI